MELLKQLNEWWSIVVGVAVGVWVIYYYLQPSESECARCGILISHKSDRFRAEIQGRTRYLCHNCQSKINEIGLVLDKPTGSWVQKCQLCKTNFYRTDRKNYIDVIGELFVVCDKCSSNISHQVNAPMEVKLSELLSTEFLQSCSNHSDWQAFIGSSGLIPFNNTTMQSQEWDDYVRLNTSYHSWDDMHKAASIKARDARLVSALRNQS